MRFNDDRQSDKPLCCYNQTLQTFWKLHDGGKKSGAAEKSSLFFYFWLFLKSFGFWKSKLNFNLFLFMWNGWSGKKFQLFSISTVIFMCLHPCWVLTAMKNIQKEKKNEWKIQNRIKITQWMGYSFRVNVWRSVRHITINIGWTWNNRQMNQNQIGCFYFSFLNWRLKMVTIFGNNSMAPQ